MKYFRTLLLIFTFSVSSFYTTIQAQCEDDSIVPVAGAVSLSTALLESGTNIVELYAIDFFFFASDNCTPFDSLRYTFTAIEPESDPNYKEEFRSSKKIFDCYDAVNSPVEVNVYVWDLAGNYMTTVVNSTFIEAEEGACDGCIMDTTPPVVVMIGQTVWPFPEGADSVEIWASDFVLSASDNCTSNELLTYSFSPISPNEDPSSAFAFFDCDDVMNSPLTIDIYTWDRHGNFTVLPTQLILQLPPGVDCTGSVSELNGSVVDLKGEPMFGANVYLETETGEILDETTTNDSGQYSFLANTSNKYLRIEYNDESGPILSIMDLVDIQLNLLGLNPYTTAHKMAADINGDGRVRVNDLRIMRKILLGIIPMDDYISKDWKFVDQGQEFGIDVENERIKIEENLEVTIVGYRVGDLK